MLLMPFLTMARSELVIKNSQFLVLLTELQEEPRIGGGVRCQLREKCIHYRMIQLEDTSILLKNLYSGTSSEDNLDNQNK